MDTHRYGYLNTRFYPLILRVDEILVYFTRAHPFSYTPVSIMAVIGGYTWEWTFILGGARMGTMTRGMLGGLLLMG